jgi:hypothetical protein
VLSALAALALGWSIRDGVNAMQRKVAARA